ncbi:MAG: hypothetical protein JXA10_18815 [Anaerolineae bacterium]|nr:hypothetical protein [Anaerolineae bacterium]
MSILPLELQKLPPQALDVVRYLAKQPEGAWVDDILDETGLTERGFGKAIRRLVTRYYAEMVDQGYYRLTALGQQAADDLLAYDGEEAPAAPSAESVSRLTHVRQVAVVGPKELVAGTEVVLRVGFNAPADGQNPLKEAGRLILRLSAPGCDVEPVERPLEVAINAPAGPAQFRVKARQAGSVRVKVEAFQLITLDDLQPVGGLFFDLNVAGFPTPASSEMQALGAQIRLYPGGED